MRVLLMAAALVGAAPAGAAGFADGFDRPVTLDSQARSGWAAFTGDGEARLSLTGGNGSGVMRVDAREDRRGIWWAVIKRSVSAFIDRRELARADRELRVEARVRSPNAPRRINLSFNHSRTTDFHSHLMEYDLADTGWHVISLTTKGFDAGRADEIFVQLAMIDWGVDLFDLEIDYVRVDVVDPRRTGPDRGSPLPYRPDVPSPDTFAQHVAVAEDAIVDVAYPWVNLRTWADMSGGDNSPALSVSGSQTVILRWDLSALRGREPAGWGLLELTTASVQWAPTDLEEFGYLRAAEVLGGDPSWRRDTVTHDSFLAGEPRSRVIGQMFIDRPPAFARGGKTLIPVSPAVLRRLLSGEAKGVAISAQGAVNATFRSSRSTEPAARPILHFSLK